MVYRLTKYMNHFIHKSLVKNSLLSNQILGAILLFSYFVVYGITAQAALYGLQFIYFLSSIAFAALIFYIRDPEIQKTKVKKGILFSQIFGTIIVFSYLLIYGISSIALLKGFQLIFFMSSYIFFMSLIYLRDPERIKKQEEISASITHSPFAERTPCFINSKDLSWLVREINAALSVIIGFSELLLKRDYSEVEKEYMLRNIYEHSLHINNSISKASSLIPDSIVKPKEIYEVVDLLDDKNFV